MLENISNNLRACAQQANPVNWSRQTQIRVLNATSLVAITAMTCYAVASVPCADAKKIDYNAYRTAQDAIAGDDHTVSNFVSGELMGRAATDGLNALAEVRKNGGSLVQAVVTGIFKGALSKTYENCLENAETLFQHLACQIFKP